MLGHVEQEVAAPRLAEVDGDAPFASVDAHEVGAIDVLGLTLGLRWTARPVLVGGAG